MKKINYVIAALALGYSSFVLAEHPFYVSASAGTFQGNYDQKMLDQTDTLPQNIGLTSQQHGYTGGLAIGYSKALRNHFLVGAELSGNVDSNHAYFAEGASSIGLNDTTQINNHIDLTFVPGLFLNDSISAYIKLGVSFASIEDSVNSPAYVNFIPVLTSYNTHKTVSGFAGGIGLKKMLSDRLAIFVEGNYHDYGTVNLNGFQNFSASYTHSTHIYSYDGVIGFAVGLY